MVILWLIHQGSPLTCEWWIFGGHKLVTPYWSSHVPHSVKAESKFQNGLTYSTFDRGTKQQIQPHSLHNGNETYDQRMNMDMDICYDGNHDDLSISKHMYHRRLVKYMQ